MTMSDFQVQRHPATKDASLFPTSDRARQYARRYRLTYGDEAMVGMSLYVETSRDESRLDDAIADLRAKGLTVRR